MRSERAYKIDIWGCKDMKEISGGFCSTMIQTHDRPFECAKHDVCSFADRGADERRRTRMRGFVTFGTTEPGEGDVIPRVTETGPEGVPAA